MNTRDKLRAFDERVRDVAGVVVLLAIVGSAIAGVYSKADEQGWVYHRKTVDLTMAPDWLDGESRECSSLLSTIKNTLPYRIEALQCPDDVDGGSKHTLTVGFWGAPVRSTLRETIHMDGEWKGMVLWRCIRKSDAFICYAHN